MTEEIKVVASKLPCTYGSFWLAVMQLYKASSIQMTKLDSTAIHGRPKPTCLSQS